MALIVEFTLSSDRLPLTDVAASVPETTIRVDDIQTPEAGRPVLVFWAEGEAFETLETALDRPSVATHTVLGTAEGRRLYRVELAFRPPAIYAAFVRSDTAPIEATITAAGWEARTRFADRQALAAFADSCRESDVSFRLDKTFETGPGTDNEYGLTEKQHETLLAAHEAGYFAVPRTASLQEIGAEFGISAPSVSERLRRAQDRLIRHTLRLDDES